MRRAAVFVLLAFCLALSIAPAFMQGETQPDVTELARYFPDNSYAFAAFRLDDAYIDQLDQIIQSFSVPLQSIGVPPFSIRRLLTMLPQGDDLLNGFGDRGAVGCYGDLAELTAAGTTNTAQCYAVIELDDSAALTEFLRTTLPSNAILEFELDDGTPVFELTDGTQFLVFPDKLLITTPTTPYTLPTADLLSDDETFQQTIAELPAPAYNILAYGDLTVYNTLALEADPALAAFEIVPVALGLTILDGDTLTIDSAVPSGIASAAAVDPNFARFIPADANAVIHATNFSGLVQDTVFPLIDTLQTASVPLEYRQPGTPSPERTAEGQVRMVLSAIGLNLDDILAWTTGDYALFARVDTIEIGRGILGNKLNLNGAFDFGIVIEAADPALAADFVARLNELVQSSPTGEVTIQQTSIADFPVTLIDAHIEGSQVGDEQNVEATDPQLVYGATSEIFFFTTYATAEQILTGGATLINSGTYLDAQRYVLPDPTSIWYTDGEGILIGLAGSPFGSVGVLALLGPSIGNIFDGIVMGLQGTPTPTPTPSPTPSPTPNAAQIDETLAPLQALYDNIRHSTMSSTITADGAVLFRMTITLNVNP